MLYITLKYHTCDVIDFIKVLTLLYELVREFSILSVT